MFAEDAQEYASLLHPSAGVFASRIWERTVLITTKATAKDEDLSTAAVPPADFLGSPGLRWQSPRGEKAFSTTRQGRRKLDMRHQKRKNQRP
jgi:hypothetical protein